MTLNGVNHDRNYLTHDELTSGAAIDFRMAPKPNETRGVSPESRPYSFSNEVAKATGKKAAKKAGKSAGKR